MNFTIKIVCITLLKAHELTTLNMTHQTLKVTVKINTVQYVYCFKQFSLCVPDVLTPRKVDCLRQIVAAFVVSNFLQEMLSQRV